MTTNNTFDGLDPRGSHIGQMTTLGQVTIDNGYRPDPNWSARFKAKHDEAEARLAKDMAEHPEDYVERPEEDEDDEE